MTAISNPYGSGGFNPQVLPSLAEGVISLQRTEQQRLLKSIEQDKQWERDDRLRNQALALQFSAPSTLDGLRQSQTDSFMKKKDAYTEMAAKVFSSNKTPETKDLMLLQTERQKLLNETMQEKAFSDAFSKMQSQAPAMRKALETEEQRADFDKQIADFTLRLKDPKQKVEVYDLIEAFRTPEPPFSYVMNEFDKVVMPKLQGSTSTGGTQKDPTQALEVIRNHADDYIYESGVKAKAWKTPQEMEDVLLKRELPYIKTRAPRQTSGGGRTPKYDRYRGAESEYQSSVDPKLSTNAFVVNDFGTPIIASFTPPDSKEPTSAKIVPLALRKDGMLEVEATINKDVTSKPMSEDDAIDFKDRVGGKIAPTDGGEFVVNYTQPTKYTEVIPYTKDLRTKISERLPEMDQYYQSLGVIRKEQPTIQELEEKYKKERESQYGVSSKPKQAKTSLTAAQNTAIDKLVKLNPTMTREQIIKQVIK